MSERFENNQGFQPEEYKELRRKVLNEMKEIAYAESPKAQEDWDLIWVLSGPYVDIDEEPPKGKRNESRDRIETGFKIAKEVTALRLGKEVKDVTAEDILKAGPRIYWNSTSESNNNLRRKAESGFLEKKYGFPKGKLVISADLGIEHTGHQFERFEPEVLKDTRKVVIVSEISHMPRIKRYLEADYNIISPKRAVLYPSEPRKVLVGRALGETKKVPAYIKRGILPPEKK